jgi:endoglucanase
VAVAVLAALLALAPAASAQEIVDYDLDGVPDEVDNCWDWNPDQADTDGDGLGDACDYEEPYIPEEEFDPREPVVPDQRRGSDRRRRQPAREPACAAAPFSGTAGRNYQAASPSAPNPLKSERWFVDPEEWSYLDWRRLKRGSDKGKANLMWRIAREPKFRWWGKFNPNIGANVREYLARVQCQEPGSVPLMAILRGQSKECHSGYQGGGVAEDRIHRRWLEEFARAVGDARVVIAYEPDSLGTIDCLAPSRRGARMDVLRYGIDLLSKLPNATIYIEAGASDWEAARSMANKLRYVGIAKVRGFMLNVTHFDWTRNNIRFGTQLSRLVGGKHFVINTSANGRGPVSAARQVNGRRIVSHVWCNPQGVGLGPRPTTRTGSSRADAFLWIGRPGYSNGSCNGGPSPPGTWWQEQALRFAQRASQRRGP